MDENRKKLYDQLSANYDMGTFDEFDSDLDNEDNQKVAWEAMGGQDGYGDFSMFQQAIQRSPQVAEAETTETTGNTGSAGDTGNTGSAVAPTEATAATMMDTQQPDWTTTASAMPSEEDADTDISLPDAPNPNTPKDQSAGDREIVNEPDVVNDKEQSGNVALHTEDYSTKSVEELYAGLGLENKEYSDEELQNELRRSAERIGWISDPVVFEQRKAEFNNSLNELQRRMLVQRSAAQVEQMKPPLAHQEVMPGLDATTAQEIADARNKRFDYLLHGESGKQGSPYTRAVSTQSGWVRSNQLIEQARHKDKSELDEITDKALNAMSSDPSQRFGSDEEAAIQLAAAMAEEQAQANGGHAKTPSERELEAYYAGPEDTYVEVDGWHDPHEEQLVRQKDAAFRAEVKRHQEGYTNGLRGYATDIEKDPLASADCPVYAIPRMVKDMVAKELREKAKERSYKGYQPGLSQMLAFSDDLEANEYDRHLKNAIRIFGPKRYEGYVLAWAKKYYTTIANARVAVDNMIRNEIINQLGLKPSNNWEYLFGSVLNNTFVTQGLKALYGLEKGTRPDDFNYITAQQVAYRQYEDEHNNDWQDKLTQMTAPALTLVADAVIGGFFLAGKAAQLTSLLPRLFYASGEAASRSLMNSAIYRIFMGSLSGAANFATYEMQSIALQQLATGEYRKKHNFWSSLGHAGVSGAAKGMVFGTVGEAFGSLFSGVSGKMVYGVEAGKLLAETATFSAMGYLENGNLTFKDVGTNFGLALSGRASHAGKLIKDIRSRANNDGIYGRKANYHKISEAEKDALVALGYGDVASALRGENISEQMLRRMQNQLEQMRLDKRVSWETIRCCDWVLNGRLNAVPGVRDKIIEADGKGGYTITAVDANGRAIMGSVHVTGTEARNKVLSSINHEIDKASWVENESKMQSSLIGRQLVETVREYAESTGEDAEALLNTYMTALGKDFDHKSLEPVEKKVYETINALRSGKGQPTDIADTKETIGKRFGVDIDQAIKTEKSQRTKEQRAALAEYQEWLDGREDIIDLHQYRGPAIERPYYGPERGSFERKRELGDDEYTTEVEKWRGGVMLGKVVVVNSLDEVTDAKVRKQIADGDAAGIKSVPGWYDSKTDTAYIYAPHIIDGKDFNETMLHEVVSHKGLRGLLGEADYNKLLDKIWEDMSPSERKALEDYPGGEENESEVERTRRLADEWLAHRAQGVDVDGRNSIWQTAKRHVKDWLRRHGIDVYYSDYELENMLRESYRELAGKGRKTKAERGGEGEPRKEGPIIEGEPEHIHEDKPDDGAVPPDDGGTTPPEGVAAPPAAEGGETPPPVVEPPVERPTAAVGRVEGTPAHIYDWEQLITKVDAASLPVEKVQEGLELLEAEREQAHRYANGELAEEPSNWEYWAARDGLSEPTRQAEPAAAEPPVATEAPKEPVVETESQQTEPVATETPKETAQRDTKLPKGANAEAETMEPSELPMTEHIAKMTDAWGDVTRVEVVGQNDNGTTRVRLWFKNRDQRGVEADVDLRGPQPPEPPTPPTEPTGDATTADMATERPAEVTGSADDRQMRDKLGELLGGDADRIADAQARLNDPNASEYEKQAARTVLRYRQRDGRDGVTAQGTEGDGVRFRVVRDPREVERLERGKKVKRYRAMQLIDGKLYPPMSARVNGQLREPTELGVWEQADENPELARNGKFRLDKGQRGQGTVDAAYNPYFHTSTSAMNDQFSSAWKRPELVVVEVEIPESELTSGYRAEGAKDSVGDTDWKSGSVNNALPADRQRTVTLSRYMKAVRIVPDAEVADMIARQLDGTDISIPFNVVNENLRSELVKRGVKIGEPEKSNAGRASLAAYEQWINEAESGGARFRHRAPNGKESNLDERQYDEVRTGNFKRWFGDWENDPEEASKVVDANGEPLVVYHQTNRKQYINRETGQNWDDLDWREREEWDRRSDEEWNDAWEEQDFYTFDNRHARQSVEYPGFFFSPRYDEYHEYGDRTIAAYLDMKNPAIDPDIPNAGVTDTAGRDAMESLMRQGYDGVIRTEDGVPYEYIVFRPEQIKSATENNGDFSRENGDIRLRLRDEHETGDRVGVRREGMNDGRVRVDGLPGEWHNIDEAGRAMRLADPEHLYVPSDDGKWLEVHDWRDNEVWDIWRGKPGSKRYEKWRERTLNHIHKQVPEYAKKLGLDVELIDNEADVPAGHENEKSWRDPETGKIYIVVPRHAAFDVSDVMSSLWHEGVSRHGLRKLVGGDNYDTFLDNVYAASDANIRAEIDRLTKEVTDGDRRSATEEYLSRLAEQMGFQYYKDDSVPVRSWMQRGLKVMCENFDNLCRHLGMADITATLRDDDLRAVLYDSYSHLLAENRDAYAVAKRAEREDKEYVKAVKRGDIDTAMTMLHRKLAASEGIVGYAAAHGHGGSHREVSHRLKDSESGAIEQAARDMAQYVPKDAVLVPMPPHEGVVRTDTDTWLLAQELSRLTGAPVVAALRGRERESRYAAKQAGRKGLSADELGFYQDMELPDGKTPVFVDNVVGSGETAKAAVQAMGDKGMTLAYTKGNLGKPIEGLKNATITYDDAGNLIPLSERFDRSNSDVRFRVRGDASGETADHTTAVEDARRRLESDDASEFERTAARAVIKAYGGGSGDAPDGGGPRFRIREPQKAIDDYERAVNSSGFQVTEALQDSMMGLKKLMQAIVGKDAKGKEKAIQDIAGFENAYLKENRLQSESVAQVDEYRTRYYTPLVKAVSALIGKGGKKHRTEAMAELTDYMMAKHGLERNIVLAERDATEEFESDANKDGNGNYIRNYDDILAEKREKDYSGLTALTGETDVAAAEDAARQMVDAYEMGHDTTELWQRTKEATDATLDKLHDSGVLSDEAYNRAKTMFEYYIPLRGWDETTSDEVYGYLTGPDGPLNGNVFKHAEGRRSKADDPLATIMMMASDAIRQGNRNVMKQRFLTFVLNNPSDAVSVNRLWLQRDPVTDEWKPVFADLDPTDSPEVVHQKVEQFEQDMAQLAQQDPDNFKHGKQTKNIPYKVVNGNIGEHRVLVKHNGQTYVMTINGNPRAAQALNGLSNPDVKGNNIFAKALEQYKKGVRMMSQLVTTYNPKFVVRNFQRDMAYSITSSALVKEGPEYAGKFVKNYAKVGLMSKLFTKWEDGTLDRSDTMENLFYEFMHNGGETGFSAPQDLTKFKKELDKELRRENVATRRALHAFHELYLRANRAVENRARFAAFVTSMEMGRGVDRSIWDAKEVSVNFNKKGAGARFKDAPNQTRFGKTAGAVGEIGSNLFMFWNAAVQGLTNYGKTVKANPVGAGIHAATMAALGYVMPQLMQAIFGDDDDYYDLPDYVRRNNICFRFRKDMPWLTIPLTQEHAVMYALGDVTAGLINGKKHYLNGKEVLKDFGSEISKALPLDFAEGGGGHWLLPSVAKPYFEAYWMNESWTGAPIANQTEWNKQAPEYQRVYKTASQPFVKASEWVNDMTNSDEDSKGLINFNPSKLEYVFKGYAGGLATLFNDCVRMFDVAFGDAEFEAHDIPVAGAMLKSGNPTTKQKEMMRQYYHYRDDAEGAKWELKNREGDALERFKQTDRYERYLVWTEMSKDVDKLKKQMKDNPDLEAEYYAAVERLVSAMREQHAGKRKPSQETIAEVKESERKDSIEALTDKQVHDAMVPLSDNAPQDSVDVKREGIKRAYKSEGLSYDTPSDRERNAQAYERRVDYFDIDEDKVLKGRRDALKKSVGEKFEKMGVKYKKGSAGWDWYADDDASASIDEIKAYYQSHKAELDEYGILLWWFDDSKGSSGYIKKGFTDGKHDPDEVMKEYREARKEVLARTKQR